MVGSTPDLTAEAMASKVAKELLSPAAIVPKTQYPPYAVSRWALVPGARRAAAGEGGEPSLPRHNRSVRGRVW